MSASTLERIETDPFPTRAPDFPQDGQRPRRGADSDDWRAAQHRRPGQDDDARPTVAWRALVGVSLLVIAVVYLVNISGWPEFTDDEGTYYSQAWAVQNLQALAPYTYWYDHPPVGWLQLAAFTWLPEALLGSGGALVAGRVVAVGYAVATALLVYMLARRLDMARGWALATMLVWALNPLSLYWGRQVLLDNVAMPWLVGAFVLAFNYKHHLGKHMLAGLCFAVAVLTKETTLIFAPALLLAVWQSSFRPTRKFAAVGFSVITALTGAMYLAYAAIRSELLPGDDHVSVFAAVQFQLSSRAGSGFILDPATADGGAYGTLLGWLDQDPYLLVGGMAAAVVALLVRRLRPIALVVVLAFLVALRPDGYLPGMYVVAVLPFCALALVGLVDLVWKRTHRLQRHALRVGAGAAVVGVAAVAGTVALDDHRGAYAVAFTADLTRVHGEALEAVRAEVPQDAVVVVDNSYWNDLVADGRDTDDVIWFYKVDSDPEITEAVGNYEGIDYLLWTLESMKDMAPIVKAAYDSSDLVWTGGEGGERVELRKVVTAAEQEERDAAEASIARQDLAMELRALQLFFAAPSDYDGLTNGQVEAIVSDSEGLSVAELADSYGTTTETVDEILEDLR